MRRIADTFRAWAELQIGKQAEWECYYESWDEIYAAVADFTAQNSFEAWTQAETNDLLYLLSRDNECEFIAHRLAEAQPHLLLPLAEVALERGEPEAKWQLADMLGRVPLEAQVESLLLRFADDEAEYVRRRALQALARVGSLYTDGIALREWNRESENQQWARMMALVCWQHVDSLRLETYLHEAEVSPLPYLSDFARRLRWGEVKFS